MKGRGFYWLAVAGCAAALLLGGIRAAYSLSYCPAWDTSACVLTDQSVQETCCATVDTSGRTYLATCTRDHFLCWDGVSWVDTLGPGYNCFNVGSACP